MKDLHESAHRGRAENALDEKLEVTAAASGDHFYCVAFSSALSEKDCGKRVDKTTRFVLHC